METLQNKLIHLSIIENDDKFMNIRRKLRTMYLQIKMKRPKTIMIEAIVDHTYHSHIRFSGYKILKYD